MPSTGVHERCRGNIIDQRYKMSVVLFEGDGMSLVPQAKFLLGLKKMSGVSAFSFAFSD